MTRVLVDTDVIISALLFRGSAPSAVVERVLAAHSPVLTAWIIDELHDVVTGKRPDLIPSLDQFLDGIDYELAPEAQSQSVPIEDHDDQPILDAALASTVDIIVTGDKHFLSLNLTHPVILTPRQFLDSQWG